MSVKTGKLFVVFFLVAGVMGCGGGAVDTASTDTPADTYFAMAVTENSHNHSGARLLFLDFQDETPNPAVIQNNVVISPKLAAGDITLDGDAADWDPAALTTVNGLVQNNYPLSEFIDAVPTEITLGSAWDENYIYFLVQWVDAGYTNSSKYNKWIYDGSNWNAMPNLGVSDSNAPNQNAANISHILAGDENEDRILMMFPITDSENNFSNGALGCAAYCHSNLINDNPFQNYTGTSVAAMYTNVVGDSADIWHWKSSRTAPSDNADDGRLVYAIGGNTGLVSDNGSPAYNDNPLSGGNPQSIYSSGLGYTGDVLQQVDAVAFFGTPAGGEQVPATISTSPGGSSRGDVEARAIFSGPPDYRWTVELRRLRNTGNNDDRQFISGTDASPPTSLAVVSADAGTGANLYATNCERCHAANGSGVASGNAWIFPRIQRASGSLILNALQTVGPMQGTNINQQQAEDIAAYLQTQATFVTTQTLSVTVNGVTDSNIIISNPTGISCPGTCSFDFITDSVVTLTANYIYGYTFTGWSYGTCGSNQSCDVTLSSDQTVTANYTANATTYTLSVVNGGNGTVSSSPAGIDCGSDCTEPYTSGANVSLTAIPDAGYRLANWGGDCTGAGSCSVSMSTDRTVTATYELIPVTGACTVSGTPPPIPDISMQSVVTGLSNPVHVTHAGDGSGRLFVVEQRGTIRVVQGGSLQPGYFLDIQSAPNDRVLSGGEMGLLSVAFHPDFVNNNRFYVNYTSGTAIPDNKCSIGVTRCTIISEFTVGAAATLEDSERIILEITQPATNHNGGQIAFGSEQPNPYLYIGMGDGGPAGNSQDLTTLLGGMLRIDIDNQDTGLEYAIPTDNPLWSGVSGARREIWAYGFRNPWRFSFDPLTGDLYAGDVGQDTVEEIDIVQSGLNYGWNQVEGDRCYNNNGCNLSLYESPLIVHTSASGWSSITGGVVYRGSDIPDMCGVYVYGDFIGGEIWGLRYNGAGGISAQRSLSNIPGVSSFGYDENYEVYVTNLYSGTLFKVSAP